MQTTGRLLPLLLLVAGGAPRGAGAAIAPGQRVRIDSPAFRGVAQVSEVRTDTLGLLVATRPGPVLIPIAEIQRLEMRHLNSAAAGAWKGVRWGAAIGAAFGLLNAGFSDRAEGVSAGEIVIGSTAIGVGVGAVWGALRPGGRWVRVQLNGSGSRMPAALLASPHGRPAPGS
jgi:hypothetical protein